MFYIRKAVQLISLIIFFVLICCTTYPLFLGKFVTIFPQFSPFLFLPGVFLVPAIILIGLTLILGRIFCGWICPLGCLLEYLHIFFPKRVPRVQQVIKYYLLLGCVICSPFLWHIEPLCLMQRVFCFILSPWSYTPYFIFTLSTFAIILFFRRKWCQSLCPLGGLLSLLSRYKRINRLVSPACNQCGRCQRVCWMNIGEDGSQNTEGRIIVGAGSKPALPDLEDRKKETGEFLSFERSAHSLQPKKFPSHEGLGVGQNDCLLCFRCQRSCPKEAVHFCFGKPEMEKIDVTRRGIIFAIGAGIISALVVRVVPCSRDKYLIRPPGSIPEDRFKVACIRCGACTKVCISHGLVPDFFGSGLIGLGSPRLMPRIGACEDYCNLCGQVCPSGAIQKLSEDEKQKKKIGTAVIDTKRCLAYKEGKLCLICDEQCLYNAVNMDAKKRPIINKKKCIGCGVCENKCPVNGEAAIRVIGREER
ncbi:4Fe-4S dicluster domain-containing protein [bacterium]|nr:4Fe-4S dicluster domain-containing protein [bacterium]